MTPQSLTAAYIEYADMLNPIAALARWAATVELDRSEAEAALDPLAVLCERE